MNVSKSKNKWKKENGCHMSAFKPKKTIIHILFYIYVCVCICIHVVFFFNKVGPFNYMLYN